jgi:hypothetical protein
MAFFADYGLGQPSPDIANGEQTGATENTQPHQKVGARSCLIVKLLSQTAVLKWSVELRPNPHGKILRGAPEMVRPSAEIERPVLSGTRTAIFTVLDRSPALLNKSEHPRCALSAPISSPQSRKIYPLRMASYTSKTPFQFFRTRAYAVL